LADLLELIVLKRPESVLPEQCPVPKLVVHLLETPLMSESSTQIRDCVGSGKSIKEWVPAAVVDFIDRRGLYKS
jgi:nicotinic acid mononucleotide adenylyltransferase